MKQFKIYVVIILLIVSVVPSVALAVWWNPLTWTLPNGWWNPLTWLNNWLRMETKNDQETPPVYNNNEIITNNTGGTTTVYGIEMQNKCFAEFQDFIKTYGEDYSKCLVSFDFNQDYCGGFDPDTQALSDENVIVILDSSGSMAEKIGSEVKIDVAKKAVSDFLTKMPKSVNTGLIVYGHKGSNSLADKDLSCKGIEEVVKLGKNNNSNIIAAINSFNPKGWTPIAGSLDFAKNIFMNKGKNDKNYLILVSDGVESCDGDPLSAAQDIKSKIPDIKLSVIGFATDKDTQNFLKRIATLGGGSYLTADNSSGIAKAFNDQLLLIKKDCINVTIFELALRYKSNNLNNLDCWLAAYKKESDNFTTNLELKSPHPDCNLEVSQALFTRQMEFWYKKQDLEQKSYTIYTETESDLNSQLQVLNNLKN